MNKNEENIIAVNRNVIWEKLEVSGSLHFQNVSLTIGQVKRNKKVYEFLSAQKTKQLVRFG